MSIDNVVRFIEHMWLLHQKNVLTHYSWFCHKTNAEFGTQLMPHSLYSLYFVPCGFSYSQKLKKKTNQYFEPNSDKGHTQQNIELSIFTSY